MTTTAPLAAGFDNGWRGRFNAWFFTTLDSYIGHIAREHKQAAFGDLGAGDIVEIGAGIGANLGFLPAGSRLVAVEPNFAMHATLRDRAADRAIELDILTASAADIPLPDASVDDVLCSLVLCTVEDQQAVLQEVRRILRPGGRLRVIEHVAAPARSPRRWLQHAIRRPWRWLYEGCDTCRDTASAIEEAGFSSVELHRGRWRHSLFLPVNTSIHGIAVK